jgi:ActR/RegA family two-component response regulator
VFDTKSKAKFVHQFVAKLETAQAASSHLAALDKKIGLASGIQELLNFRQQTEDSFLVVQLPFNSPTPPRHTKAPQ